MTICCHQINEEMIGTPDDLKYVSFSDQYCEECSLLLPIYQSQIIYHIEKCARNCYKSENKEGDYEKAKKFFKMLCKNGHHSPLAHSNFIFRLYVPNADNIVTVMDSFVLTNPACMTYFRFSIDRNYLYISTNLRAWLEFLYKCNNKYLLTFMQENYKFINESMWSGESFGKYYEKFNYGFNKGVFRDLEHTFVWNKVEIESIDVFDSDFMDIKKYRKLLQKFWNDDMFIFTFYVETDRGISHEFVRHTTLTFSQESTRYIKYDKKINFIDNRKYVNLNKDEILNLEEMVNEYCQLGAILYKSLNVCGISPQFSRDYLPHAVKTSFYVSGRRSAWEHFFETRLSKQAHPKIRELASKIKDYLDSYKKSIFEE